MFGISFFSNKVAKNMFRAGYSVQDMPPNNVFKLICDALKANGYNEVTAAELWLTCLQDNDRSAIEELKSNAGIYGQMLDY